MVGLEVDELAEGGIEGQGEVHRGSECDLTLASLIVRNRRLGERLLAIDQLAVLGVPPATAPAADRLVHVTHSLPSWRLAHGALRSGGS